MLKFFNEQTDNWKNRYANLSMRGHKKGELKHTFTNKFSTITKRIHSIKQIHFDIYDNLSTQIN